MEANKLKNIRKEMKATQSDIAEALHVTYQTVLNWEKGKTPIPFLADVFIMQMYNNYINGVQ